MKPLKVKRVTFAESVDERTYNPQDAPIRPVDDDVMESPSIRHEFENLGVDEAEQTGSDEEGEGAVGGSFNLNQSQEELLPELSDVRNLSEDRRPSENFALRTLSASSAPQAGSTIEYSQKYQLYMTGSEEFEYIVKAKTEYDVVTYKPEEDKPKSEPHDDYTITSVVTTFGVSEKKKHKKSGGGRSGYCLFLQHKAQETGTTGHLRELIRIFNDDWNLLSEEEKQEWKDCAKNGKRSPEGWKKKEESSLCKGKPISVAATRKQPPEPLVLRFPRTSIRWVEPRAAH